MNRISGPLVVLVALLLAACGGGAEAGSDTEEKKGATPRPAMPSANDWPPPSVLEIEEPEAPEVRGERTTRRDAEQYADYLAEELGWVLRTTFDARALRRGDCSVCDEYLERARSARAERRLHELDDFATTIVETTRQVDDDSPWEYWQLALVLEQPEIRVLDEHDEEVEVLPARELRTGLVLAELEGNWEIVQWVDVDQAGA